MNIRFRIPTAEENLARKEVLSASEDAFKRNSIDILYRAAKKGAIRKDADGHFVYDQIVKVPRAVAEKLTSWSQMPPMTKDLMSDFVYAVVEEYESDDGTYRVKINHDQTESIDASLVKPSFDISAKVFSGGRTLLQKAAADEKSGLVVACLELGADPNADADGKGWTPLHFATYSNSAKSCAALVAAGSDTASLTRDGRKYAALHFAAQNGYDRVVEILLDGGANPNQRSGTTRDDAIPLYIDFKSKPGATPLDLAVANDKWGAVSAMVLRTELLEQQKRIFALLALKFNADMRSILGMGGIVWLTVLRFLRGHASLSSHRGMKRPSKRFGRETRALAAAARLAEAQERLRRTNGVRTPLRSVSRQWLGLDFDTKMKFVDRRCADKIVAARVLKHILGSTVSSSSTSSTGKPSTLPPRHVYKAGDRVQCRVAGEWVLEKTGVVVKVLPGGLYDVRLGDQWSGMDLKSKPSIDLRVPRVSGVASRGAQRNARTCSLQ